MITAIITITFLISMMGILSLVARRFPERMTSGVRKRWLVIHIICVLLYFGGTAGLVLVHMDSLGTEGESFAVYWKLMQNFDYLLIIPGGIGTFLSGVWLCVRTSFGLARYGWIIAKWAGTLFIVTMGIFFIGTTLDERLPLLYHNCTGPDARDLTAIHHYLWTGEAVAVSLILALVILSYIKPKKKKL